MRFRVHGMEQPGNSVAREQNAAESHHRRGAAPLSRQTALAVHADVLDDIVPLLNRRALKQRE